MIESSRLILEKDFNAGITGQYDVVAAVRIQIPEDQVRLVTQDWKPVPRLERAVPFSGEDDDAAG